MRSVNFKSKLESCPFQMGLQIATVAIFYISGRRKQIQQLGKATCGVAFFAVIQGLQPFLQRDAEAPFYHPYLVNGASLICLSSIYLSKLSKKVTVLSYLTLSCSQLGLSRFYQTIALRRQEPSPHENEPSPHIENWWSDSKLIEALENQGFSAPIDRGGFGKCLFYSIAVDIEDDDLDQAEHSSQKWRTSTNQQNADFLRKIAIKQETEWMNNIKIKSYVQLSPLERQFINTLYVDMLEELTSLKPKAIFQRFETTQPKDLLKFCCDHFDTYIAKTSILTNWAGTPEAMAIAFVLKRSIKIFGKEVRVSPTTPIAENGELLPIFDFICGSKKLPITIFQTNGGGHYMQLPKKASVP